MALIEKVCLYYREGASDKVYEIHLTREEGDGEGYRVTGYNGRRGTKLVAQPKTERAVPYRTARYVFDNLEAAKLNHRRTPYRVASHETNTVREQVAPTAIQKEGAARAPERSEEYRAAHLDALEF